MSTKGYPLVILPLNICLIFRESRTVCCLVPRVIYGCHGWIPWPKNILLNSMGKGQLLVVLDERGSYGNKRMSLFKHCCHDPITLGK